MTNIYGPKDKYHPSIGLKCPICERLFEEGDYTFLVPTLPAYIDGVIEMDVDRFFTAECKETHSYCIQPKEKRTWWKDNEPK